MKESVKHTKLMINHIKHTMANLMTKAAMYSWHDQQKKQEHFKIQGHLDDRYQFRSIWNIDYMIRDHKEKINILRNNMGLNYEFQDGPKIPKENFYKLDFVDFKSADFKEIGFSEWEPDFWLFPKYLYPFLSKGMKVYTINDEVLIFDIDEIDSDDRDGYLAFGLKVGKVSYLTKNNMMAEL